MAQDTLEAAAARRRELANFLKSRRARLAPRDVGFKAGGRRRVPGLRREEVAALADVGLTWYTALETAAAIGVSDSTLARIADALMLDSAERDYVFKLARGIPSKTESAVSPRIREAVDAIFAPAYVIADDWTILYWNAAFAAVWKAAPPGSVAFNVALSQFTDPKIRQLQGERWEAVARSVAAQLRSDYAAHMGEPDFEKIMQRLRSDPEFNRLYEMDEVRSSTEETSRTIFHPELGPIEIVGVNLLIPGTGLTLTIELPQGDGMARLRKHMSEGATGSGASSPF